MYPENIDKRDECKPWSIPEGPRLRCSLKSTYACYGTVALGFRVWLETCKKHVIRRHRQIYEYLVWQGIVGDGGK